MHAEEPSLCTPSEKQRLEDAENAALIKVIWHKDVRLSNRHYLVQPEQAWTLFECWQVPPLYTVGDMVSRVGLNMTNKHVSVCGSGIALQQEQLIGDVNVSHALEGAVYLSVSNTTS